MFSFKKLNSFRNFTKSESHGENPHKIPLRVDFSKNVRKFLLFAGSEMQVMALEFRLK
jgi:hypothetical protein